MKRVEILGDTEGGRLFTENHLKGEEDDGRDCVRWW
jgi:hypothetical protein